MGKYIGTVYDTKARPYTDYPRRLCAYLIRRFGIKEGSVVLDAGCGRGDFAKGFRDSGMDVYGLDGERYDSPLLKGIRVRYADMEKGPFPYEDNSFDVVFSKSVIEHLCDPGSFLRECRRVLKPGGRIVVMTPDWISQMKIFYDDYTHRQPYTVAGVKDTLKIFRFREAKSEIFYQLPVLWRLPALKSVSRIIALFVPVTLAARCRVRFIRWSVELMALGTGRK